MDPVVNANSVIFCSNDVPQSGFGIDNDDFKNYVDGMQTKLESYDAIMKSNQEQIQNMVKNLTDITTTGCKSAATSNTIPSAVVEPNTISPHARPNQPPCDPYIRYVANVVSDTMNQSVKAFVSEHQSEFVNIGGRRETLYYGEFGYRYNGGKDDAKAMPAPIMDLLNAVRAQCSHPNACLNSCLITLYKSGTDHIPPHKDDEPVFDHQSEVVTISIGAQRDMEFSDNSGVNYQTLSLENIRVLVSSRFAQDFWVHGIKKYDDHCEERISFTFRNISPHFLNSTVIVGDSNTRLLQLGDGKG